MARSDTYLKIAVVGAGAAGVFAAIHAAEANPKNTVIVFEKTRRCLSKVKISGGGRCNVTHACFDPRELVQNYPRGSRELLGAFYTWQPEDTIQWFKGRGVVLKTEVDGRMFPITDNSQTIIDTLLGTASGLGVKIKTGHEVSELRVTQSGGFQLLLKNAEVLHFDKVIITSGGGSASGGLKFAKELGHQITELVPSLFTFCIDDSRIEGLQGLSVPAATITCGKIRDSQTGPVLITHWGLSGPGILKLSAWGAQELAACGYRFEITINWLGDKNQDWVIKKIDFLRQTTGKRSLFASSPFELPKRLWESLLVYCGIEKQIQWSQLSREATMRLVNELIHGNYQVTGKSTNKDEFVTCGGVPLHEVDLRTMESKIVPGLYFAGEVLDIDGITGGFNFQAAWTTGYLAGQNSAH